MSEAERLAAYLTARNYGMDWRAAAELRRLSAELEALKKAMGEPYAYAYENVSGRTLLCLQKEDGFTNEVPLYALTKDQS